MKKQKMPLVKLIMLIITIVILVLVSVIVYIAVTKQGIAAKKPYDKHLKEYETNLSDQEKYQQDLKFIYEEIKNNYVNLEYKEELLGIDWNERYELYSLLMEDAQSKKDFYRICNEFISELKDGHTWFGEKSMDPDKRLWAPYSKGFISALQIRFLEGRPFIVANRFDSMFNGYEVLDINEVSVYTIIDNMIRYQYRRGNDESAKAFLLSSNEFYQFFLYDNDKFPEKLVYELMDENGEVINIELDSEYSFDNDYFIHTDINFGIQTNRFPTYKIKDEIGYIRIDTFDGNPDEIVSTFDDIVKKLKEANVQGVVLDVRNNGGGNESFRDILGYLTKEEVPIKNYHYRKTERYQDIYYLRFLWNAISSKPSDLPTTEGFTKWYQWRVKPAKEQFLTSVPVAVLSNESIFSSTDDFVYTCLENNLATVVGNSAPMSGNGLSTQVVLPSGDYILSYSVFESVALDGSPLENIVLEPDVIVEQTYDDFINGVDTQLEEAIRVLKEQVKPKN